MSNAKETLKYILQSITQKEDNVAVEEIDQSGTKILEIIAPQEIIGKIIGKEGKIIKSIRNILFVAFPEEKFFIKIRE